MDSVSLHNANFTQRNLFTLSQRHEPLLPCPLELSQESIMSPLGLVNPSTMSSLGSPLVCETHSLCQECCGTAQYNEMFRKGAKGGAKEGSRWLEK